jgi:hypothetical protein
MIVKGEVPDRMQLHALAKPDFSSFDEDDGETGRKVHRKRAVGTFVLRLCRVYAMGAG